MELRQLQQHIHTLVALEETESPVTSLYLNLQQGEDAYRLFISERMKAIKENMPTSLHASVLSTLHQIHSYLSVHLRPSSKGVAIFARPGKDGIFLPLEFKVAVPNVFVVSFLPSVYHLFELKDDYHRYVAVLPGGSNVRILEVSLGEVTNEIQSRMPDMRTPSDRAVSHHGLQQRTNDFIEGQIHVLDRLVADKGYSHVVVGGESGMTDRFFKALPHHLAAKAIRFDLPRSTHSDGDIVELTNRAFAECEEQESCAAADRLARTIKTTGHAVVGAESSLRALQLSQAEMLVMLSSYDPSLSTKNHMVRLAERSACKVEIAHRSETLDRLGGVGCLLRYEMTS